MSEVKTGSGLKIALAIALVLIGSQLYTTTTLAQNETRLARGGGYVGLDIKVYAPYEANLGDKITVRVRVEAKEELHNVYITLWIKGSRDAGHNSYTDSVSVLKNVNLASGVVRDEDYTVTIPYNIDAGSLYCDVIGKWSVYKGIFQGWVERSISHMTFNLTYLRDKAHEDLQTDYENLQTNYNSLMSRYNTLETQVTNSRNLNYLVFIVVAVFVGTTIYFAMRKPKKMPSAP